MKQTFLEGESPALTSRLVETLSEPSQKLFAKCFAKIDIDIWLLTFFGRKLHRNYLTSSKFDPKMMRISWKQGYHIFND